MLHFPVEVTPVMTMHSKFPGTCKRCNGRFPQGTLIEWTKAQGAQHIVCPQVQAPQAPQVKLSGLSALVAFLQAARDRGLKFPKARFLAPGNEEMRLSVSGLQSRVPGSVQVVVANQWIGRVEPDGTVKGQLRDDMVLQALLEHIAQDPAQHARAYGALMCRCSFCSKSLTDDGSVEVGYGPVCAQNYGLPHTAKGTHTLREIV